MSERIDDVTIVGGGDAGLLTALALRQLNPALDVSVVDDFQEDVPQVGKSTYWKICPILHDTLDIHEETFFREVKPIWKATVYFRDWCGYPEFHFPFDQADKFPDRNTPNAGEHHYHFYENLYDSPDHRTKCEEIVAQGASPWYFSPKDGGYDRYRSMAYHLDTDRFNDFLRSTCRDRGISLVDDEIVTVEATGDHVDRVRSERQAYESDLYVDATGFNRVVRSEQDGEFVDFDFPLDTAFNARVDRPLSEVEPATVVETGEYGWFWQIDTYDSRDLGYVFASEFVSDDEARAEFVDHCGGDVAADDVARFEFDSGYQRRAWRGNCVVIGNAAGFVEPLQSTGLTANAQAAVNLSNLLAAHGRIADGAVRDTYNAWVERSWKTIRDFIAVHYLYADGDSDFWRAMQSVPTSPRLEFLVREFDRNGFDAMIDPTKKADDVASPSIFRPISFYVIMRNMGATSEFYETNDFRVSDEVEREEDEYYERVRADVEKHLSTEEFYRGVLEL